VFYPLTALLAAAAILASLNFALVPHVAKPQAGVWRNGALVFGPEALQHVEVGPAQEYYLQRNSGGWPVSIQIATKKTYAEPAPNDVGVRLLLAPQSAAALAGMPLRVELQLRPLLYTTAPRLSISVEGARGGNTWVEQPFPRTPVERYGPNGERTSVWVQYTLPATQEAPKAIGFWPEADASNGQRPDFNVGVEIVELRLAPGA
jgi:hypothetical protein